MTETPYRAFLLGRTAPAEAESLEVRALGDNDVFEAIRDAEYDLFDDYAEGRLSASDRQAFEARFGAQADRLAVARALARLRDGRAAGGPGDWRGRLWTIVVPLAAAAAVTIAVGGAWLLRGGAAMRPKPVVQSARATPSAAPVVALVMLDSSRAAATPVTISIPSNAPALRLRVRLDPLDRYESYAMALRSSDHRREWQGLNLRAASEQGDLILQADVPASAIATGSYELAVRGGTEDLGFVTISITRIQ